MFAGCGGESEKLYPVTGKVLIDGKPAAHATVVFHPVGSTVGVVRPRAKVEPDGSFKLTTHETGDGAPAGDYQVTVELWLSNGRGDEGPTSRLPAKFAKPDSSGLTATVNPGPNELKPITIKR